jgi:hypothetical protein
MLNVAPSNLIYIYNSKLEVFLSTPNLHVTRGSKIPRTTRSNVGRRAAYISHAGRSDLAYIYMVPVPHQDMPVFGVFGGYIYPKLQSFSFNSNERYTHHIRGLSTAYTLRQPLRFTLRSLYPFSSLLP